VNGILLCDPEAAGRKFVSRKKRNVKSRQRKERECTQERGKWQQQKTVQSRQEQEKARERGAGKRKREDSQAIPEQNSQKCPERKRGEKRRKQTSREGPSI